MELYIFFDHPTSDIINNYICLTCIESIVWYDCTDVKGIWVVLSQYISGWKHVKTEYLFQLFAHHNYRL